MFSRGNVTEKARFGKQCCQPNKVILDMYTGIEYYTLPDLFLFGKTTPKNTNLTQNNNTFVCVMDWNEHAIESLRTSVGWIATLDTPFEGWLPSFDVSTGSVFSTNLAPWPIVPYPESIIAFRIDVTAIDQSQNIWIQSVPLVVHLHIHIDLWRWQMWFVPDLCLMENAVILLGGIAQSIPIRRSMFIVHVLGSSAQSSSLLYNYNRTLR